MVKIIIADDHAIFRQGLVGLLLSESSIDIVLAGEAEDGRKAIALIEDVRPDMAIIDISMPIINGLEVVKIISKMYVDTKVIILTMHKDPSLADKAIKLGAWGYILKDNAIEDLVCAIKTIGEGRKFISSLISPDLSKFKKTISLANQKITRRELDVITLIAGGLSNKDIANKLFISVKTVETHRSRIMAKFNLHKTADLVRYAYENKLYKK